MFNLKSSGKKVWLEIKKAKDILMTLHPSPDGDSIGSNLALYHALTKMGKKVTLISGDSQFPNNFITLPGTSKITNQNFFDLDLSKFDLFIINDIAALNQISRQGEVNISKNLTTIIIDHHVSNTKFANINLVDIQAPATCQLVYDLFQLNSVKITKDMAICLLVGIYTDTGGFKYRNTTTKTFLTAANLSKINPDFNKFIFEIENNDNPDRLKFLSLILGSIKTYCSDKVAVASLDYETIKKNNIDNSVISSSEVANMVKSVIGWEIGICMIESQPNYTKVSFRTRDSKKYDLSKISAAVGGGGHMAAAGATINKPLTQATDLLIEKVSQTYKI